ncbi:LuxR C-terminal-related transcriptional regulator [Microbacterium luticocti]|uniref:LuxR C-terminal-related transcriptional regulator n=1 Tax=Microbacterium luticocti TaxID=451764 RepID=UPI0004218924|nr:LuxR C-terminal-related transcriptional regulator [Microbacterium luticocti]
MQKTGSDEAPDEIDPVVLVRRAAAERDVHQVAALLTRCPIELWFRMPPSELQLIIDTTPPRLLRPAGVGTLLMRASVSGVPRRRATSGRRPADGADERTRTAWQVLHAVQLRLAGDPVQATEILCELPLVRDPVTAVIDPGRGERASVVLQAALSAMLAGRERRARVLFEKALVFPVPPTLAFFRREAHLRIAIIEALDGDPDRARRHLHLARQVPRTDSWAEAALDTDEALAEIATRADEHPEAAFADLLQIPIAHMHELWPYHALATYYLGMRTGRLPELRERLAQLRAIRLAGTEGTGLMGSVLAQGLVVHGILAGVGGEVAAELEQADDTVWQTAVIAAGIALVRGAPPQAMRLLHGASEQTRGLTRADTFRRMVLAVAHAVSDEHDDAESVLADIAPHLDPLTLAMLGRFAPTFAARAAQRVPGWPTDATVPADQATLRQRALTARELELLTLLARGLSRTEIAQELFITVNTVKTHQRSLYRKLGATTRTDALREGRRRGLV